MRLPVVCFVSLWFALGPHLPAVQAQNRDADAISEELARQKGIFQSKGQEVPTGYSIDRTLEEYTRGLSFSFDRALSDLGPQDRWLDVGAGTGQAILDYYTPEYDRAHPDGLARRGRKAHAVAMSIEDRRTPAWYETAARLAPDQIRYVFGKPLRDYTQAELGSFRLITDVLGGFSYTDNLSRYMEAVMMLLQVGGQYYGVLQDVASEEQQNKPFYANSGFLTELSHVDTSSLKVCAWLKSITCVRVTCEFRNDWKPPLELYRITKECADVSVPELTTTRYEAGTPPERRFQLRRPLPAVERELRGPTR